MNLSPCPVCKRDSGVMLTAKPILPPRGDAKYTWRVRCKCGHEGRDGATAEAAEEAWNRANPDHMQNPDDLLPCRNCSGTAYNLFRCQTGGGPGWSVQCNNCFTVSYGTPGPLWRAIESWNLWNREDPDDDQVPEADAVRPDHFDVRDPVPDLRPAGDPAPPQGLGGGAGILPEVSDSDRRPPATQTARFRDRAGALAEHMMAVARICGSGPIEGSTLHSYGEHLKEILDEET